MKDKPPLSRAKTWILIVIIGWFALWYYSSDILEWSRQTEAPAYTLSAADLVREYEANEIAADLKYKGKIVLLGGTVKLRGKDIIDTLYVAYDVGNPVTTVQCYFNARHARRIADVALGQYIQIKGTVDRKMINVIIRNCSIVE
jgi:hypothetical protein